MYCTSFCEACIDRMSFGNAEYTSSRKDRARGNSHILSQNKTRLVSFLCKGENHGTILEFMFFIILNMYANEANAPGTTITACIIVCLKFHSEVSDQILLACDFTK